MISEVQTLQLAIDYEALVLCQMVTLKILLCFLVAPGCDDDTVLALMPVCIISVQVWHTSLMCFTLPSLLKT